MKTHNQKMISVIGALTLLGLVSISVFAGDPVTEFNLSQFSPDQSLWSEKAIGKFEKAKITDEVPLALLRIERLNIDVPVYTGTSKITLDRGLGAVAGTASPGEVGNIGLSGHRDSYFRPLKDVKLGDNIEMQTPEGTQYFEVSDISIVDALDVSVLDPTDTTVLTLITCHPFYYQGYAPDRYIVRATPVGKPGDNVQKPDLEASRTSVVKGLH
ncbi:MAG: sortase [Xanthomonadales bacterium]|nr:sortase [Xanthomonadales bacterium]